VICVAGVTAAIETLIIVTIMDQTDSVKAWR
jgi:hypothetical protein